VGLSERHKLNMANCLGSLFLDR